MRRATRSSLLRLSVMDLVVTLALLALPVYSLVLTLRKRGEAVQVAIYQGGGQLGTHALDRDTTVRVDGPGVSMKVEFRHGAVRVAESNCPNQLCVRTGWARRPGQSIVCVPNKVLVQLRGEQGVDAVSY